jgi:hypothetical protein
MSRTCDRLASLLIALALATGVAAISGCAASNDVKSAASNTVKEGEKAVSEAFPFVHIEERRDRGK